MRRVLKLGPAPREKGAVLITVLLLVTFMSVIAVAMMDSIRFGVRQTTNHRLVSQADWLARGAEELAEQVLIASWRSNPGRSTLNDLWSQSPTVFPVDGGYIEGVIIDRSNCFNLNSVIEGDGENRYVRRPEGAEQYQALLTRIGIGGGDIDGLVGALVDWVDSDTAPGVRGAEDAYYTTLSSPYRTANRPLVQTTELRALRGYSELIYQRILPFVCALPHTEPSLINVNTLTPGQAPLLAALIGEGLEVSAGRQIISERPDNGYRALQNFWAHRSFAGVAIPEQVKSQFSVRTRYFESRADVILGDAFVSVTTLFEQAADGSVRKVSRRQGSAL